MNEKIPQIIKKNVEAEQETNKKAEQIKHHSEIILDEFIENIDEALPDNNHPEDLEIVKEAQMLADDIDNNYGDIEKMEESKKELSKLLYYLTNKEITTNIADRIDNFKSEFEKDEISKKKEKEENKKEANNSLENEYKKNINHIISEIQNLIFELKQENLIDEIEEKKYKKELNNIKKIKTEKQANCIKKLNKLKDIKDNLIFTKQKIEEKEEMNKINKLDKSLDVQDKVKRLPVYMEMEKLYEEIKKNIFTLEQNKKEEYYNKIKKIIKEEIENDDSENYLVNIVKGIKNKIVSLEEIKKEIEQEELTKPVEKIIDNDIGAMLNTAKIRIENIDNPEDIEKKLEQAVFAQSKGIRENQEIMERINNILEQISKEDKVKADETKMLGLTKSVSEITGIEKEKIKQIIKNQENKIKEKAEQELYSGSFKRKLAIAGARWGAYIGLGAGVGALTMATGGTAGVFGGSALAGIRMAEGAITAKILGKKLKIIENELKKQLKENQIEKDKFLTDIIAEIALNKQEEIDHRGEEKQEARNNLEEKREAYLKKGKWTEEKKKKEIDEYQEYSEAVNYLKKDYEKSLNDYLDERYPDLDLKEKEACVNAMLALFQNEENTELLKQEFFKKGLFKKGIDKIQKVLDSKWLGGKDTIEKKLRTVAVFAGAGYLARQSNTVKRILFTFAGAKVGSAMADLILKNTRADDILSKVKAEDLTKQTEISDNLFNKAKAQLMDYNFKKENPSEYAKLREEVEKIEKEKISKAEKAEQLLAENNEKLKNKILEKKLAEQVVKRGKITMQILGAGAGFAFGELFVHSAQAKANSANETDGQIEIKGDTNVTEDNATQENKEQKSEKILAEEKEAQGMKEFLDINIKRQKEIQKALDIFCNENNIDIVNEEKLTDEQAVEFFRNSINHNYKPENISVVLESHISDWGIVENKYLHSIDVSNIGSYDAGASDKGTEETETYKPKITDNNFEKDSTAESLKSPLVEFTDKKLESVVNKYSKQNHIDDINDISDYQLKGLIEELDKEKISQNSLANFLRDQLKMNDSEIQNIEAKTFEISKGDSIWTTAEKYLQAKYSDFNNLGESDKTGKSAEALKTYNIDKIKDKIIEIIKTGDDDVKKQFGLEKINNPDKITIDQLKNIKFDEIDKTVFNDGKLTDELSNKKIENIVKNNETLKDFFHKHPDAPRSTQNYQDILDGSGSVEKTSVLEIGGQTDETNAVNIEKFEKLNISGQRTIIDDLHNQSREIDKITNASEDAKDSLRKERAKINILKTNLIQIFNEQHQTEIKEYKNLNNEIGWMEKEKLIQAKDNLLVKGKEFYIKPFLSRYFGIFWDEEKWEKAKTLNMSEVSDKKHSDIANKKLLSHLSEIKKSFGNPLERETVGKYLERFEVGEAEKRFELNDKKENLEKLGKIIGRENTESENITDKKIINTNSNKSQIKKIPTMDTRE